MAQYYQFMIQLSTELDKLRTQLQSDRVILYYFYNQYFLGSSEFKEVGTKQILIFYSDISPKKLIIGSIISNVVPCPGVEYRFNLP